MKRALSFGRWALSSSLDLPQQANRDGRFPRLVVGQSPVGALFVQWDGRSSKTSHNPVCDQLPDCAEAELMAKHLRHG
jgi:hypothetical protein